MTLSQKPTTALQLPFQFDTEKLAADLATALKEQWVPHFNTDGYQGNWKVIPLYAPGGDGSNIYALSAENTEVSETPLLQHCLFFKEVINTFECPVVTARLLRLER